MFPFVPFFVVLLVSRGPPIGAITTIHHDKPDSVTISTSKSATSSEAVTTANLEVVNVTLTPSERKKRLLPYENFYLEQSFNAPHRDSVYMQQYKNYDEIISTKKKVKYQPVRIKTKDGDSVSRPSQKFTPFLESNALPGPFRPMIKNNGQPITIEYVSLNAPPTFIEEHEIPINQEKDRPNLSSIYETLSQLKLRQQELRKPPYGYRLVPPPRYQNHPPEVKQHRGNQRIPDSLRYKIQPSKTTIETFTATNIDITGPGDAEKGYDFVPSRYVQQVPTPIKENQEPKKVPKSSYPVPDNSRKPQPPKQRPQNPNIYVQRKPERKPLIILRKPQPMAVVEENYTADKYLPFLPLKFNPPIYVETQYEATPSPNYDDYQYEPQYPVTTKYVQVYKPTPRPVEYQRQPPVATAAPTTTPTPEIVTPEVQYHHQTVTPASVVTQSSAEYYQDDIRHATPKPVAFMHPGDDPNGLANILKQLQDTNALPQTLTPDNIDSSIKTLVKILEELRTRQKQRRPPIIHDEYDEDIYNEAGVDLGGPDGEGFDTPDGGTPGRPGVDYPALSTIPPTSFSCKTQRYKGFFGDPDTNCQVWHYCDLNGGQASFLCPNGTIFSQVALTCDWWYNVKCASTAQLYVLNERLYKYIIPLAPKFPEDYSGPLVDKYLALKFQEMEEKLRKQKKGKGKANSEEDKDDESEETVTVTSEEDKSEEMVDVPESSEQ
ncbi:uncharacterized protein LOC132702439 isoform X2 [Cylas formicarius]|uniref:uncharacterized protein LOC132702439 isoform X2 n=1 Tax=Cylas formicarius TaxID=197179 RepID=UPI00295881F2|nr:uncharacterized protein LOC132702439 isoform X2 [Cylas formicarius]